MKLFADLLDVLFGGSWGLDRLADGRIVFYPWGLTRLAYIVPSQEVYRQIRHHLVIFVLCALLILPSGFILAIVVAEILARQDHALPLAFSVFTALLVSIISFYVRWARNVTRNLALFNRLGMDGRVMTPVTGLSFNEGVKKPVELASPFSLYALCGLTFLGTALGLWILVTDVSEWKTAVLVIVFCITGTGITINAIRVKRKYTKSESV